MAREHRPVLLSYADFLKLPPDSPGEVLEGELIVTPAPIARHQYIVGIIARRIGVFLDEHPGIGIAFFAPLDVVLRAERPAIVVQPDVLFITAAREEIIQDAVHGPPDLVVEVVSPGNNRHDAVRKRELYGRFGVREYWLVWPDEERIDVFTSEVAGPYPDPRELGPGETLTTALLPGFALSIEQIFGWRPRAGISKI